ncbi:MAG TPA: tetratricopeptide repeat protein [Chitinophagaceae bacterium]|nr:tetratricopeptide repeat protein [Chitinophagaceae bacterium]
MHRRIHLICFLSSLFLPFFLSAQTDSLENYVNRLKNSNATGGSETAFLSIGSDFLYAQQYFESGNFSSAEYSFMAIVRKDKDHPYANYQLAISLLKQNDHDKSKQAQEYLERAFSKLPSLRDRYKKDIPAANTNYPENIVRSDASINNNDKTGGAAAPEAAGLDAYINGIKYSRSTGGEETAMLSAGLDAFYGIEYFEAGDFRNAETRFSLSLAKEPGNPYVNYLKAVSLSAQGKNKEAKSFLNKAILGDKDLEQRFKKDAADAASTWKKSQEAKELKTQPVANIKYGGKLVYGNYTCHQSVWNGPNVSPAYSYKYHGYFQLRKDGTYRWLDDGATGRYSYDKKNGEITWLSGYFKSAPPKKNQYRADTKIPQVTVTFSDTYKWECGCKK